MSRTSILVVALVALLLAAIALAVALRMSRWTRETNEAWELLHASADESGRAAPSDGWHRAHAPAAGHGEALPPPVARYFETVLERDSGHVVRATLRHEGEFALKPNQWKPFTSRQLYVTAPRGFLWDASIAMFSFLPIRVRDGYFLGRGTTTASLGGAIPIVDAGGRDAMADASLLRYLAEAAWFPTALLPGDGIEWTAIDDSTARVTLTDDSHRVSLDVHFGRVGGIVRVTGDRGREEKGKVIPTPWEGRFSEELLTVGGMRIPASGEVAWLLPEGRFTYWRGRVVNAGYDVR